MFKNLCAVTAHCPFLVLIVPNSDLEVSGVYQKYLFRGYDTKNLNSIMVWKQTEKGIQRTIYW